METLPPIDITKPPRSAYLRFYYQNKDRLHKAKPQLSKTDLLAVASHIWSSLPEDEKQPFRDEEKREK